MLPLPQLPTFNTTLSRAHCSCALTLDFSAPLSSSLLLVKPQLWSLHAYIHAAEHGWGKYQAPNSSRPLMRPRNHALIPYTSMTIHNLLSAPIFNIHSTAQPHSCWIPTSLLRIFTSSHSQCAQPPASSFSLCAQMHYPHSYIEPVPPSVHYSRMWLHHQFFSLDKTIPIGVQVSVIDEP